jgi:hypothetical protein
VTPTLATRARPAPARPAGRLATTAEAVAPAAREGRLATYSGDGDGDYIVTSTLIRLRVHSLARAEQSSMITPATQKDKIDDDIQLAGVKPIAFPIDLVQWGVATVRSE